MKSVMMIFCFLMLASFATAQTPSPSASPAPSASPTLAVPAQTVVTAAPASASVVVPAGDAVVAAPSAPPQWAQDLIVNAQKLPVVGPFVAKALLWLGIISAILTALVAFLLAVGAALKGVLNLAGLTSAVAALQAFQDGPIMYYLKYISMFNAQKKDTSA